MRKKLTAKTVEALQPAKIKRYEVRDLVLPGFGVRVSVSGRKTWFCNARHSGKMRRHTLGTYPKVSLLEAREAARQIMRDVELGVFEEPEETGTPTLGETIPKFIELYAKPKNRRWDDVERILNQNFTPLFAKPLDEIKRADVVRVLDDMMARGKRVTANVALSAIKKVMNWSLDRGVIEANSLTGLKPPVKILARDRFLSDIEITRLLRAAEAEGYPFGTLYLLLLITGQRRSEVSGMRWSEIDFERRVWTIPAARSKNKLAHDLPLADPVIELLSAVPRFPGSDFVFTTTGTTPISGFGRAKDRVEAAVGTRDWRVHDLRRTAASGMARLGIAPHVIEKVLNHKSGIISGVAAVYNRYGYEKEKREALDLWALHLKRLLDQTAATSIQSFRRHETDPARILAIAS